MAISKVSDLQITGTKTDRQDLMAAVSIKLQEPESSAEFLIVFKLF